MRFILWPFFAAYLLVVGLWPAAAAPVVLATAGLAVVIGAIPAPVLALAAAAIWLKHRTASKAAA